MDDILEEGYSWDNQCWSFENSCYDGYPQEWRALDDHSELENQLDCHSEPELLTADSEVSENEPSLKEEDTLQALGDTDKVSGSEYVLKQLDRMLAQQIQTLRKNPRERLKIVLKARPRCLKDTLGPLRYRTFHWPGLGKTSERQGEYVAVLSVIIHIVTALRRGWTITKRDLYYKDKHLYKSQAFVNQLVDDLAFTLGVSREDLSIAAAAKGLVCGSLLIHLKNNTVVDCSGDTDGILIPKCSEIERVELRDTEWLLVIEKEAVFRSLAIRQFSQNRNGLIVTGKGYPDLETRKFLNFVSKTSEIPVYVLTDFNPHGVEIFSVYKNGSISLSHEREHLVVPSAIWIGVRFVDLSESEGLLNLTDLDVNKATRMLEQRVFTGEEVQSLEWMVAHKKKGEIEALGNSDALETWLENRILEMQFTASPEVDI